MLLSFKETSVVYSFYWEVGDSHYCVILL
uniref:Uncharacterized protein n=1 Tax=Rhizophora mucronata TaxID=61149 RepID=A0A2P2ND30_RHIMU